VLSEHRLVVRARIDTTRGARSGTSLFADPEQRSEGDSHSVNRIDRLEHAFLGTR
jgi:hypothetical protein